MTRFLRAVNSETNKYKTNNLFLSPDALRRFVREHNPEEEFMKTYG